MLYGSGARHYDVVVVGSGPNGLSAANAVAERGCSVLVVEGQAVPGGAIRTENLTLAGFRHDTFSAVYPAAVASPVFQRWSLERFGLEWVHPEVALAHPLEGGGCVSLHRDLDRTVESLESGAVGDGERWASFAGPYLRKYGAVRATVLGSFPPIRGAVSMLRALGLQNSLEFLRVTLSPASTIAEDLFRGEAARSWFYGLGMHSDLSPHMPGTAMMAVHLALLGHAVGWPSPRGGAAALADALIGRLTSFGGELWLRAPVAGLAIQRGRVIGVRVGGEVVTAKAVLCAISPAQLLQLGGSSFDPRYRERLRRFRQGPPVLKIDWALGGPIPWLTEDARRAGTVHVGAGTREMVGSCQELGAGRLPSHPFLILGQQSLADGTRAPAGHHTAWAYTRIPPEIDDRNLALHVERMESQIERFAPSFRDRILARNVLGPAQMEKANPNLVGGDIGGGSYALDQMLLRPAPALSPYRTPIRGLYLASASTFPGGSVHGVCGWAAAQSALNDRHAISKLLSVRGIS
jgi:phytoene dehydrogenase-like protein